MTRRDPTPIFAPLTPRDRVVLAAWFAGILCVLVTWALFVARGAWG